MGEDSGLRIDIELEPFRHHVGLRIGQTNMACGNHEAWQGVNGHMIGRQMHRPLIDHHRAIGFIDFLVLQIIDSFGRDVERKGAGRGRLGDGSATGLCGNPGKRNEQSQDQPANQAPTELHHIPYHVIP